MLEKVYGKHWRQIIDTMLEGLMLVDPDGKIIFVNQAFEYLSGYNATEVVGKSCEVLGCDTCFGARAEGRDKYCALFKEGKVRRRKCTFIRKDGKPMPVLKNAAIIRDENNEIIGGVENLTDLSPVKKKEEEITRLRRQLNDEDAFHGMIGKDAALEKVFDLIASAAASDAPVIIYGESGTGKELVAKAIHNLGTRNNGPYIKVNCAALNENLLESELFGHVKGAFSGADRTRMGRFEAANNGDIFLDEIGDLPLSTQTKMLRVLQEKEFEKVGDNRPVKINVRFISATNKNLTLLMQQGTFREDLYYRIGVIPIVLPPLRQRIGDLPLLADFLINRHRLKTNSSIRKLNREALALLMNYHWPGNIRELINILEYAFVLCHEDEITPDHLPIQFTQDISNTPSLEPLENKKSSKNERQKIIEALKQTGGKKAKTANILGMSRVTLWKKIKKYDLQ